MSASHLFLVGLSLTLGIAFAVIAYLGSPLHGILVELCGTRERAAFWLAFANVTLTLAPLIFAMQYRPDLKAGNTAALELTAQLKWALAGLLVAVLILGWVLSSFIRRQSGPAAPKQAPPAVA